MELNKKKIRPKRFMFLSCGGKNTGSYLRIWYLARNLEKQGYRTDFLPALDSMPFKLDFILTLFYYPLLFLFRPVPDFLVIGKAYPNALVPALAARFFRARVVLDIDDYDGAYHRGFLGFFISTIQKILPFFAHVITTHNQTLMADLKKAYPKKARDNRILFLDQGVDTDFTGRPEKKDSQDRSGLADLPDRLPGDKKVVLYMAHMNIASEFPLICNIFREAQKMVPALFLLAAGGGPDLEKFKALAGTMGLEKHILFTGPFRSRDLPDLHRAADLCLVYYSKNQANKCRVSMKAREHICFGLPVVCNEFAAENIGDLVFKCSDSCSSAARALAELALNMDDPVFKSRIIQKCRTAASIGKQRFSWFSISRDFVNDLKRIFKYGII
jgi:hypothetical protein